MPLSKIDSDSLNTGAVTSTALASGVPTRAQLPAGSVLQVVSAITEVSAIYTTSTPTSRVSLSITPSSASSKIMLFYNAGDCVTTDSTSALGATSFYRNGSSIRTVTREVGRGVNGIWFVVSGSFLDSPSSTSAQTYAVFHFNASGVGAFKVGDSAMPSVLTAMEIAA